MCGKTKRFEVTYIVCTCGPMYARILATAGRPIRPLAKSKFWINSTSKFWSARVANIVVRSSTNCMIASSEVTTSIGQISPNPSRSYIRNNFLCVRSSRLAGALDQSVISLSCECGVMHVRPFPSLSMHFAFCRSLATGTCSEVYFPSGGQTFGNIFLVKASFRGATSETERPGLYS